MKIHKRPDPEPHLATLALLRVWLLELWAVLVDLLGHRTNLGRALSRDLRGALALAERDFLDAVVLLACARTKFSGERRRTRRPRGAPPGFRWAAARRGGMRILSRRMLARPIAPCGGLLARAARLKAALDRVEALIEAVLVRARLGRIRWRPIAVAPAADPCVDLSAPAVAGADTS